MFESNAPANAKPSIDFMINIKKANINYIKYMANGEK